MSLQVKLEVRYSSSDFDIFTSNHSAHPMASPLTLPLHAMAISQPKGPWSSKWIQVSAEIHWLHYHIIPIYGWANPCTMYINVPGLRVSANGWPGMPKDAKGHWRLQHEGVFDVTNHCMIPVSRGRSLVWCRNPFLPVLLVEIWHVIEARAGCTGLAFFAPWRFQFVSGSSAMTSLNIFSDEFKVWRLSILSIWLCVETDYYQC